MLSTRSLRFTYPSGPSFSFPDLTCHKGEHLLILGESGKGKTTLLHLLAGLLKPASGTVQINGTETASLSDSQLDRFRGSQVGIVFQTSHFVESLTVEENLLLPRFLSGKSSEKDKVRGTLSRLNLLHRLHSKTNNLSVGEQQRAAIARAIMNDPAVILADEPTSALDDQNCNEVITLLEEQADLTGASLVIVTHDKRLKDRFRQQVQL